MNDIIVMPGIGGSGAAHWQTLWERENSNMRRFAPASWDSPDLDDWIGALDRAIDAGAKAPVLVAHSLSCLLIAHWAQVSDRRIAGAFLVAVPDPGSPHFPDQATGFAAVPEQQFNFPSLIIASTDDPYASLNYAHRRAEQWGAGLVELGAFGHINGASGLGDWQAGSKLLVAFMTGCAHRLPRE